MKLSTKTYILTVAFWLVGCVGYTVWRLATYTPNPIDGDFYAHNWGFQLIVLIIFRLPIWIAVLLIVLCIEMVILKRRKLSSTKD